jgi:Flp pilus assembly pilin Flp
MRHTFHKPPLATDEQGQTMAEYGVLITAIAVAVALVIPTLGTAIGNLLRGVVQAFGG